MTNITQPVGRGVSNRNLEDVKVIQQLLNQRIHLIVPLARLVVDGKAGSKTIAAIEEFQKRVVKLARPDGRVDPDGKTFTALSTGIVPTAPTSQPATYQWPIDAAFRMTTRFNVRDAAHTTHNHRGIDLAAPSGTAVLAARAGRVLHSGTANGFGHWVVLQHNGQVSVYGHLDPQGLARVGTQVAAGDQIATIGHNQGTSTGDHLHFEIRDRVGGQPVDPETLLPRR